MRLWAALLAVLSAFGGVRKRQAAESDRRLKPYEIIAAALLLALLLIVFLLWVVRRVTHGAGG
ncbi:DUF2970 domain-containing protein [Craterilacuibacter sinensis]|uniref:DUF2970 domain-containing protein n=1 Tax=Craterilacuibacter sinensis TaxID=2686017 RepID=A0A845BL06_9NEIS|nr:DUF2970 domain-containing protein [Craterilacuibacter sinensis]MXR36080.1 DUF2970 domain-containing protein [Craterilacuibacter sinensis]